MENFNYKVGEVILCDLWHAGVEGDSYVKGVTCEVVEGDAEPLLRALSHKQELEALDLFLIKGDCVLNTHHKDIYIPAGLENE